MKEKQGQEGNTNRLWRWQVKAGVHKGWFEDNKVRNFSQEYLKQYDLSL
jgi:hypothetical protein